MKRIADIINRISENNFRDIYSQYPRKETMNKLSLSFAEFDYLVKYYHAQDITTEHTKRKRAAAKQQKQNDYESSLTSRISKEQLVQYYIQENHSVQETVKLLNITEKELYDLIRIYDCKKPKTLSSDISKNTKLNKYGSKGFNNREQATKTCLDRYGVDNPSKCSDVSQRILEASINHFGEDNINNWQQNHQTRIQHYGSLAESYKQQSETYRQNCLEKYGVPNTAMLPEVKLKIKESTKETFQTRYGVDCYWLKGDATRSAGSKNSSYNRSFAMLLDSYKLEYEHEYRVENYLYDFRVGNILIEIDPAATHNVTWNPYLIGGISKNYHQLKSQTAAKNGFRCIHVFEWDDTNKIIEMFLLPRQRLFARSCCIRELSVAETRKFCNQYHLQGYANDKIRLGLFNNSELVSVMTFGKPRYNKQYEYELIRYCTSKIVIGGSEKLFSYFLKRYTPQSIVSYCDTSKFVGSVYEKLGFTYKSTALSSHWYNIKTKQHILDSTLRKRGFDQLFGTSYGKGTDNIELMKQHGFVEVVDAGQATFIWSS